MPLILHLGLTESVNVSRSLLPDFFDEMDEGGELETFEQVENRMKRMIDSVILRILPYVIRASADVDLSGKCMAGLFKLLFGMQKLEEWALKMVDATGKPPSGVIQGTSMSLGDFDECLAVKVGKTNTPPLDDDDEYFHGRYCTVECKLPKGLTEAAEEYYSIPVQNRTNTPIGKTKTFLRLVAKFGAYIRWAAFRFGVCIPSTCGEEDLGSIVRTATKQIGFPMRVLHCQEKPKARVTMEQGIILAVLGAMTACVLAGTVAHNYFSRKPIDPNTCSFELRLRRLSETFSLVSNTKKLFDVSNDNHQMPFVRGMLVITVVFNVLAHTYMMYNNLFFYKYSSVLNFMDFMQQFSFTFIANGSNGIENYFFFTGFMLTWLRWNSPFEKVRVNLKSLLIKPYIRMTLIQLLAISLFLLLPLIGNGPFWGDFVGPYLENCRQRWWTNILYIQNYWASEDACLYHTWLLAAIMQCYVGSSVILYFLIRKPNIGIAMMVALIVTGMAAVGATVFVKQLPGALAIYLVDIKTGPEMWNTLFIMTFDHSGSFCIGLLTGYVLAKYKDHFKFRPKIVALLWCITVAALLAVIFGLYEYREGPTQMNSMLAILYAMMNRNVYGLFLAWFTIACATDNAGFIPKLLGWKALIPGYRLCILAYLAHLIVIYYHVGIMRERVYLSHEENVINYFGYIASSFIVAYVCYILFQAPYMYFEEAVFSWFSQGKDKKPSDGTMKERPGFKKVYTIGQVKKESEKPVKKTLSDKKLPKPDTSIV